MAIKAESKVFKKASAENFKSILKRQKKDESDPKFAISDSLQEYQAQLEKSAGYTSQAKLNKAEIRQEIIQFVIDYPVMELDALKGMDFDDAKTQQKTTEKTIKEYEGLFKKGIITEEELAYIQETVGKTNIELKKILGLSTKLSLSFRDFKKELSPLKLAKRIGLTNAPIIGKRIERAIESEERAESKGLSVKRALRKKEKKTFLKKGGVGPGDLKGKSSGGDKEDLAKRATRDLMGDQEPSKAAGYSKETAVEEERESDKQFDTSSNLLERILEESELTNELLGKDSGPAKKQRSLLSKLLTPLAAIGISLGGLGLLFKGSIASLGTTLGNSMSTMWQGTKSLLGFGKGKTPAVAGAGKNAAKTALRTGAATTTATTTAAAKSATKNLVKENVKKGAKVAGKAVKGIARVGGRIFLPLAAAMSIFDAASGVAQAGELLGKEDEDLTFRDKASSGFAGFLSGLTFGLVDKKKMANKLAGDSGSPAVADQHDDLGLIENTSQKKLDKVEELKVNNIDRLITKDAATATTNVYKQGDTVNQENKTVHESATIGTYVPERKMYHDIR
jgi:hypothetical protein